MQNLIRLTLLSGLFALIHTLALAEQASKQRDALVFGVTPQKSVSETTKEWGPFIDYLSAKTGLRIVFATAKDISTFKVRVSEGAYDIVYIDPPGYVLFHKKDGYRVFANAKDTKLVGILVVRKDGPIKTIHDLEGQTIAFPAFVGFASRLIPATYLSNEGVHFSSKYVGSHESVYLAVAGGIYPAGGGIVQSLGSMDQPIQDQLRILWTSPAYAPHAFAAKKHVSPEVVKKIQAAMLDVITDKQGAVLLKPLPFKYGFAAAADGDYDSMRNARIPVSLD